MDKGIKDTSGFYCKSNKFALFYVGNVCLQNFVFANQTISEGQLLPLALHRFQRSSESAFAAFATCLGLAISAHGGDQRKRVAVEALTISLFVSDFEAVKSCSDLSTSNLECLECSEGSNLGILMQLVVPKRIKSKAPVGECLRLLRAVGPDVRCQLWARNWSDRRFCFLIACK